MLKGLDQLGIMELFWSDIHCHLHIWGPETLIEHIAQIFTGGTDHPEPHIDNHARGFKYWNKVRRGTLGLP